MKASEYEKEILKIIEIDMKISSLADCRRTMAELSEREAILIQIRDSIKHDMRKVEKEYLKNMALIRDKYSKDSGILGSIKGIGKTRAKELKELDQTRNKNIESYEDVEYMVDDLLVQIQEIQDSLKVKMKEMLGNF